MTMQDAQGLADRHERARPQPSHGGNTGSNPVGDARFYNRIRDHVLFRAAVYGKYTAKVLMDRGEQRRIIRLLNGGQLLGD
jgi:hypothetical protein